MNHFTVFGIAVWLVVIPPLCFIRHLVLPSDSAAPNLSSCQHKPFSWMQSPHCTIPAFSSMRPWLPTFPLKP
ncbi:hypothetical protein IFO70_22075 [Phormidium tenue FACHB-886]|nr:hypothetical protein [Phormidium tenue FACHB-886]